MKSSFEQTFFGGNCTFCWELKEGDPKIWKWYTCPIDKFKILFDGYKPDIMWCTLIKDTGWGYMEIWRYSSTYGNWKKLKDDALIYDGDHFFRL